MLAETVTPKIPEMLYHRPQSTVQSTQRSFDDVVLYALQVGSPPVWNDVPTEFQADLAAMDKLDDAALWQIVCSRKI